MTSSVGPLLPSPTGRRRLILVAVLRGLGATIGLTALYYILPLDRMAEMPLWPTLAIGIVTLTAVTVYQVRAIIRAAHPAVRAIQAMTITGPLFLYLFASTYFVISHADAANFNVQALTRNDALYFTVTVFATVGFGDIVATSQSARVLVTVQMILDLIVVGAVIRVFIGAVRHARQSPSQQHTEPR